MLIYKNTLNILCISKIISSYSLVHKNISQILDLILIIRRILFEDLK